MADLDFQDHPYEDTSKVTPSAPQEHTVEFSDFPPDATEDERESQNAGGQEEKPAPSLFTLAYYQQYFDVDTTDVLKRLMGSMIPNPHHNYLEYVIRPKPDLYGPFWVCATLTFSIAITGNVADFFRTSGKNFEWKYDYGIVSLAATVIFAYWLIIPLILWGVLKWRGGLAGYTLTELICVYGYSLAIFIPCSILWLIPVPIVNYLLAALCSLLSGATIIITIYPAVKNDSKQVMAIFMVVIVTLHALLATGFVMYFFQYTSNSGEIPPHSVQVPTSLQPSESMQVNNTKRGSPPLDSPSTAYNISSSSVKFSISTKPTNNSHAADNQPETAATNVNAGTSKKHKKDQSTSRSRKKTNLMEAVDADPRKAAEGSK